MSLVNITFSGVHCIEIRNNCSYGKPSGGTGATINLTSLTSEGRTTSTALVIIDTRSTRDEGPLFHQTPKVRHGTDSTQPFGTPQHQPPNHDTSLHHTIPLLPLVFMRHETNMNHFCPPYAHLFDPMTRLSCCTVAHVTSIINQLCVDPHYVPYIPYTICTSGLKSHRKKRTKNKK